jgi:hypothetical protein
MWLVFEENMFLKLFILLGFFSAIMTNEELKMGAEMFDEIWFLLVDLIANITGECSMFSVQVSFKISLSSSFLNTAKVTNEFSF